jgi:hypothetical protein
VFGNVAFNCLECGLALNTNHDDDDDDDKHNLNLKILFNIACRVPQIIQQQTGPCYGFLCVYIYISTKKINHIILHNFHLFNKTKI